MALRIGIAFAGDSRTRGAWSGIPAGLAGGLARAGVEVVHLRAEPPPALQRSALQLARLRARRLAARAPLAAAEPAEPGRTRGLPLAMATLRDAALRVELARAGRLDGLVQIATDFTLPARLLVPSVTLEDMTVQQALRTSDWRPPSPRALQGRLERQQRAYRRASGCCFATRWAADSAIDDYGIDPAKVHVVGFGRNVDPLPCERDWSTPRFLFVAKEWESKGGPTVVRAFGRIRERMPAARLDLVGGHPPVDAPGVTSHGLLDLERPADRVLLERLYASATCFVMPSRFDAAGIVYVEAGAAGVASIGTTAGGAREFVGEAGSVVDPDDEDALVAAMAELADGALARELGERARRRAEGYTWPLVAERMLRALGPPSVDVSGLAEFL